MRPAPSLSSALVLVSVALLAVAGCSGDSLEPGPPVTTQLTCPQGGGQLIACDLTIPAGGFRVTLVSSECGARGNSVRITRPFQSALTNDGCFAEVGTVWPFPGPYAAGTSIGFEITAPSFPNPPSFQLLPDGTDRWTIRFEDGADSDLNDLVFRVEALPAPAP